MSVDPLVSVSHREWEFIRARVNDLHTIPHPDTGWWALGETTIRQPKIPYHLHERGLIERRPLPHEDSYEYRTPPGTYHAIQAEHERRDTLPCGHTGVVNHGSGDYGCSYEYCQAVHSRDTVEEAMES